MYLFSLMAPDLFEDAAGVLFFLTGVFPPFGERPNNLNPI